MPTGLLTLVRINQTDNRPEGAMGVLDKPDNPSYDFARERWNEFMFQPTMRLEIKMRAENLAWAYERLLSTPVQELERYANRENNFPALLWACSNAILRAGVTGRYSEIDKMLNRIIGSAPPMFHLTDEGKMAKAVTFTEFCSRAGYPVPFPKQIEMMEFGMSQPNAKLMLGSRGYGKTDYVVILGIAWSLFQFPDRTFLVVTKSESRNRGIAKEIVHCLEANQVVIQDKAGLDINVIGQRGKDPSVSIVTLGSKSFRGRHPYMAIMDDPVTPDDAASLAARKKASTLYFELLKLTNNVLVIGQPAHKSDLYADLRPLLHSMEIPHGTIPQLDHDLEAMKLAGVSLASIEMSYHLRVPVDSTNPLHNINSIPEFIPGGCVAFIDPSFEGGDYTAMTVLKGHFDGVAVYGRVWQRAWYDVIDEILDVIALQGVDKVAFEINALGEQPIKVLRLAVGDRGLGCGIVKWRTTSNKHARIMAIGPFAKMIYVSQDSDLEYRQQVKDYEYGIKNDDAPDSLASGLEWVGLVKGPKR